MSLQQIEILLQGIRDVSGAPLAGGKVDTFQAGTTTPQTTYTDSSGVTPEENPIILDGNGRKLVYADGALKLRVKDANGNILYTWDNLYFSRALTQTSQWPDIYGGTSGGAGNAFTIFVSLSLSSYSTGQQFTFISNQTINGSSTLSVNGLSAIPIVRGATPSSTKSGDILSGQIVSVIYDSGGGGRFRIINDPTFSVSLSTPPGSVQAYLGASAPVGWLICDGSAVSRTTYASLFSVMGVICGAGDGSTTFNLPDMRQKFPIGKAASGTGSTLGGTGGTIDHVHAGPSHTHALSGAYAKVSANGSKLLVARSNVSAYSPDVEASVAFGASVASETKGAQLGGSTDAEGTGNTGTANPPFLAVNYIIKF